METIALVVWVEEENAMESRSKNVARPFISGPNGVKVCSFKKIVLYLQQI